MIRGVHTMFYSSEPEALRAFLRDKMQLPYTDVGEGWLIFDLPEADMGCHPAGDGADAGTHNVSFYCDDVQKSVAKLKARGVEFIPDDDRSGPPEALSFALVMLATTPAGDAYTFREYEKMVRAAGFSQATLQDLRPSPNRVIVASR